MTAIDAESLADDEIVRRVREGEPALFAVLMRRHQRRLRRAAWSILRNDTEAEDVAQHACVQAYACMGQFEGRALFSTWLTRIAVHEALARQRRRWREPLEAQTLEARPRPPVSAEKDPEAHVLHGEQRRRLAAAIEALPSGCRDVFVLTQLDGLTTGETAARLGLRHDAVRARLHRARARLREALGSVS